MTLDELRALLEVIDTGSINQAATRMGVPRSTLNRRLEALESWFGTKLLSVSRNGAQPTPAGLRLARGAGVLLRQAAELDASVRLELQTPTRPVEIVTPPGLPPLAVAMAFQRWCDRFPEVQLRIQTRPAPFLHLGSDESPDFIMSFERPTLGDYRIFQLMRTRLALKASAAYLERHGTPDSVDALGGHKLWVWEGALNRSGGGVSIPLRDGTQLPITPAVVIDDPHNLYVALRHGMCLGLVPTAPVDLVEAGGIEVLKGTLGNEGGLWVAVPEQNAELAWSRRMIVELREFFSLLELKAPS